MIVGFNEDEGTRLFDCTRPTPEIIDLIREIAYIVNDTSTEWASSLLSSYGGDGISNPWPPPKFNGSREGTIQATSNLYTDLLWATGTRNLLQVASKTQPIWGYYFGQKPPFSSIELPYGFPGTSSARATCMGVYHSAALPYLFGDVTVAYDAASDDLVMADYMIRASGSSFLDSLRSANVSSWLSFVYYGHPNHLNSDDKWEQFDMKGEVLDLRVHKGVLPRMIGNAFRTKPLDIISAKVAISEEFFTLKS